MVGKREQENFRMYWGRRLQGRAQKHDGENRKADKPHSLPLIGASKRFYVGLRKYVNIAWRFNSKFLGGLKIINDDVVFFEKSLSFAGILQTVQVQFYQ